MCTNSHAAGRMENLSEVNKTREAVEGHCDKIYHVWLEAGTLVGTWWESVSLLLGIISRSGNIFF